MRILPLLILRSSLALILAGFATISSATPNQHDTGHLALQAFLEANVVSSGERIVGMTGFYGQTQPSQWLILTTDAKTGEPRNEYAVEGGKVAGLRKVRKLPQQELPNVVIQVDRLKIDSDKAFDIAEGLAQKASVGYDSVHYQLRCREYNKEPVWTINMLDPSGKSIGIHYISAESGDVLRSSWHRRYESFTSTEKQSRPVSLLYGAKVTELVVSGKADQSKRKVTTIIQPKNVQ